MRTLLILSSTAAGILTTAYAVLCALLYLKQEAFIFPGAANDPVLVKRHQAQRVEIPTDDVKIEGWWSDNPHSDNNLVVLYFGGNAEDILYVVDAAANRMNARRLLASNYRGYGGTRGKPSEAALLKDALAVYDYAVQQPGISARNIIVMGRSLGSGVAAYVASRRPVGGAVLITPYDNMAAIAQHHYPYFPTRWLLRHSFPAADWAKTNNVPVLIVAAERDTVIPPQHARRLFDRWAGSKEFRELPNTAHNDIEQHPDYYPLINGFLKTSNPTGT